MRGAGDWLIRLIAYPALAALLLEIAARFRMRDLFGLMALAGIYGLLNGLLINPDTTLVDIPRTWFTRVMGAQSLMGLLMLSLFFAFSRRFTRTKLISLFTSAGIVGTFYGVWGRWAVELQMGVTEFIQARFGIPDGVAYGVTGVEADIRQTALITLLLYAVALILIITALCFLLSRRADDGQPLNLRLSRRALALVLLILVGLFALRLLTFVTDTLSLMVLGTFILISLGVLYYQQRKTGGTLLDSLGSLPVRGWLIVVIVMSVVFIIAAIIGYGLERGTGADDPIFVITNIFTSYGLFWLPAVCLVLAARAFIRLSRQGKL